MSTTTTFQDSNRKVEALINPRNIVVIGASERPGNWAMRSWANIARYRFPKSVFLINPNHRTIFGTPCYPDFENLPEKPDQLLIAVPANKVTDVIRLSVVRTFGTTRGVD